MNVVYFVTNRFSKIVLVEITLIQVAKKLYITAFFMCQTTIKYILLVKKFLRIISRVM